MGLAIASRTLFVQNGSLPRSQWHFSGVSLCILLGFGALSCVWLVWLCKSAAKRELAFAQMSMQIYVDNEDYEGAASALGIAALIKVNRGDLRSANSLLVEAVRILPRHIGNSSNCSRLDELHFAAFMLGDQGLIKVLHSKWHHISVPQRKGFLDATSFAIIFPVYLLIGLLASRERTILPLLFARRWRRQLAICASGTEQIKLLDNLTTLYIYQGKLDQADSCSRLMLRRAEELGVAA